VAWFTYSEVACPPNTVTQPSTNRGGRRYADTPNVATAAPRRHRFRCGIGAPFDLQRYVAYLGTVRPDDVVIVGVRIVAVRKPCVHVARLACPVHGKL